jgi:hypothetical protein
LDLGHRESGQLVGGFRLDEPLPAGGMARFWRLC